MSLIELLIVISLLSGIAYLSVPLPFKTNESEKVIVIEQITNLLKTVRALALQQNREILICLSGISDNICQKTFSSQIIWDSKRFVLPDKWQIAWKGGFGLTGFKSDGRSKAGNGSYWLCYEGVLQAQLVLNTVGRIKILAAKGAC